MISLLCCSRVESLHLAGRGHPDHPQQGGDSLLYCNRGGISFLRLQQLLGQLEKEPQVNRVTVKNFLGHYFYQQTIVVYISYLILIPIYSRLKLKSILFIKSLKSKLSLHPTS